MFLQNKHRIPKRKETIPLLYCLLVRVEDLLLTCKSRNKHDERRLGKMEIRDKTLHQFELVTGINKNLCPAALRSKTISSLTVRFSGRFDGSAGCRSNADHPMSALPGSIDEFGSLLRHNIELRMHVMFFYRLGFDRAERSQSDVQCDMCNIDAHLLYFSKQFLSKMQTCRRCRSRTFMLGIDCIVAGLVFQLVMNVRRERHRSERVQRGVYAASPPMNLVPPQKYPYM